MTRKSSNEAHQLNLLLEYLVEERSPDLPFCVEHRDRPDFLLTTRSGKKIGLEVTSFTGEEVNRVTDLRRRFLADRCISTSGLRDRKPRRSNEALIRQVTTYGAPWESVPDEIDFALTRISEALSAKRQKFRRPQYEKFQENWLLLTDEHHQFCDAVSARAFIRQMTSLLKAIDESEFNHIYVVSAPICVILRGGSLSYTIKPSC